MGDLRSLPIRDQAIDLTVCGLALTHLEDLRPPIAELARVTKTGGHVVISDIHPFSVALGGHALFRDVEERSAVVRNHQHWHSHYIEAFEEAGLRIRGCVAGGASRRRRRSAAPVDGPGAGGAVQDQDPVQVVDLVLDGAGLETA